MPWTDRARVFDLCVGCGDCVAACPESIVVTGRGGHPFVDFSSACTFCGACADACRHGVFDRERTPPWSAVAHVGAGCFEASGISCRACEDACDADALRFRPELDGLVTVFVDAAVCTGCGACVALCPPRAMEVVANG
jgi:ferredoxin-type protein NapF